MRAPLAHGNKLRKETGMRFVISAALQPIACEYKLIRSRRVSAFLAFGHPRTKLLVDIQISGIPSSIFCHRMSHKYKTLSRRLEPRHRLYIGSIFVGRLGPDNFSPDRDTTPFHRTEALLFHSSICTGPSNSRDYRQELYQIHRLLGSRNR